MSCKQFAWIYYSLRARLYFGKDIPRRFVSFEHLLLLNFVPPYFRNTISDKNACLSENEPNLNLFNKTKHFWYFERVLLPRKVSKKVCKSSKIKLDYFSSWMRMSDLIADTIVTTRTRIGSRGRKVHLLQVEQVQYT